MDTRDTRNTLGSAAGRDVRDVRGDGAVPDVRTPAERAAMRGGDRGDERSIGDLIKDLRDETTTLVQQELALAKTEISEKASQAAKNSAYVGVGAVLCYLGLFFALTALAVVLALALDAMGLDDHGYWLGPLIVGAIVGIVGWSYTQKGLKTLKHQSLTPDKTVQSLQEDKQWLQEKVSK